jgi:hypothetical protein
MCQFSPVPAKDVFSRKILVYSLVHLSFRHCLPHLSPLLLKEIIFQTYLRGIKFKRSQLINKEVIQMVLPINKREVMRI